MGKVVIMDHPLIQHKIGIIRRKETGSKLFREMVAEIAMRFGDDEAPEGAKCVCCGKPAKKLVYWGKAY